MEEKQWFLYVVDHHEGPFTADEIKNLINKGDAKTSSYVWREGLNDWMMMSSMPEFGVEGPSGEGHGPAAFIVKPAKESPALLMPSAQPQIEAQNISRDISNTPENEVVWCLNSNGAYSGPHSMSTIARMIDKGKVSSNDSIWKEGWGSFVSVSGIPELMVRIQKSSEKKSKTNAATAVKGLAGSKMRKTSFSALKTLLAVLMLGGAAYQLTAIGLLDSVYQKVGLLEKVKSVNFKPVPMPSVKGLDFGFALSSWENIRSKMQPLLMKYSSKLPEPLRKYINVVQLPNNTLPKDISKLQDAAFADLSSGVRVAVGLLGGDVMMPRFVMTSNLPDGAALRVILRGKEGMLLDSSGYLSEQSLTLQGRVGYSQSFMQEGGRALPQGQYTLSILSGDESILVENYFFGGVNDTAFQGRLSEFNARMSAWQTAKIQELLQVTATLESIANESATNFFNFSKQRAGKARTSAWRKYSAKYTELSSQLGAAIGKTEGEVERNPLKGVVENLKQGYDISEQLHKAQSAYLSAQAPKGKKPEKMDLEMAHVRDLAAQLVRVLNSVKTDLKR